MRTFLIVAAVLTAGFVAVMWPGIQRNWQQERTAREYREEAFTDINIGDDLHSFVYLGQGVLVSETPITTTYQYGDGYRVTINRDGLVVAKERLDP